MEDVQCNLCTGRDEELRFEINGYNIVRCRECGLVYTNPRPHGGEQAIYGEEHPCYSMKPKRSIRKFRGYVRRVERFVKGGDLLDVGCATGEFLLAARASGWRVTGLDVSEYATNYAREKHGLPVITGCMQDADLPPESFDVITLWATIEHMRDPKGDLKSLALSLRPGGLIVVYTGNISGLRPAAEGAKWPLLTPPEHLYFFSLRTLCQMLDQCGFDILRTETAGRVGVVSIPILKQIGNKLRWGDLMYVYGAKR